MKKKLLFASLICFLAVIFSFSRPTYIPKDPIQRSVTDTIPNSKTAAKNQPKDTSYFILGSMADYQLLYRALIAPGDVTPNQMQALAKWVQSLRPLPDEKTKN